MARRTAGFHSASAKAIARCTHWAMPTRSRPGSPGRTGSASWWAGSMGWALPASFAARACSAGKAMRRKWRWPGWSRRCARRARCCSIASFPQVISPRWARWKFHKPNICACWTKQGVMQRLVIPWSNRPECPRLPPPAHRRPQEHHRVRAPQQRACQPALPRSWPQRPKRGCLPRPGTSSRSP